MSVVQIDLGMIEETELVDVEAAPDGSALLTWRTSGGHTLVLALPAEAQWEVGGDTGSWVVRVTFDGPASVSLDAQGPLDEFDWNEQDGDMRLH